MLTGFLCVRAELLYFVTALTKKIDISGPKYWCWLVSRVFIQNLHFVNALTKKIDISGPKYWCWLVSRVFIQNLHFVNALTKKINISYPKYWCWLVSRVFIQNLHFVNALTKKIDISDPKYWCWLVSCVFIQNFSTLLLPSLRKLIFQAPSIGADWFPVCSSGTFVTALTKKIDISGPKYWCWLVSRVFVQNLCYCPH